MAELDSVLIAIVHHSVSRKELQLDISGAMISDTIWTETLAATTLAPLRVMGNWVLYSSLVHHVLPTIPSRPPAFFEIMHRCILHLNVYTQFFIKTGIYAAEEDPFIVAEDEIAGDAFVLLCAMLLRTNGSDWFLSWFGDQFRPLFFVVEQAYTTYMDHGSRFLAEQNQHCFPNPRVVSCAQKRLSPGSLPSGPRMFKSLALLRLLRKKLTPSLTLSVLPCTPPAPQVTQLQPPLLPSPTLFASLSTLEKEHNLRIELISRKHAIGRPNHTTACKQDPPNSCIYQSKRCPLSDLANLPLRTQQ
ncbi:hypothetical protein FB451DRAFT_263914 [Mycena latifolia]|nr:hypothetical protein FB451DRAFT_263914 [Mycena latifolia]